MNGLLRWWRFNLVGAMGMVVQLGTLAVFARVATAHYLWASTLAVELALLHNFVWHTRYTWSDRRGSAPLRMQLLRFHLSTGLVSLLSNLVLMRLLVASAHLPVLAANLLAIICCGALNYCVGDAWTFAATP
jgi:putative flippase GtrA